MEKKYLIKEAIVLLIAITMILSTLSVTADTREKGKLTIESPKIAQQKTDIIFEDSFETYEDFSIDFPPWINIDVDGDPTFSHSAHTWPNDTEPKAFIIFNPSQTSPPMTEEPAQPHSGEKYAACFAANNVGLAV